MPSLDAAISANPYAKLLADLGAMPVDMALEIEEEDGSKRTVPIGEACAYAVQLIQAQQRGIAERDRVLATAWVPCVIHTK